MQPMNDIDIGDQKIKQSQQLGFNPIFTLSVFYIVSTLCWSLFSYILSPFSTPSFFGLLYPLLSFLIATFFWYEIRLQPYPIVQRPRERKESVNTVRDFQISIFIVTWNLENQLPENLSQLIPIHESHDIYVIGVQECDYQVAGFWNSDETEQHWNHYLMDFFSTHSYSPVGMTSVRSSVRLAVFAKPTVAPHIHNIQLMGINLGLPPISRKGALAIGFELYDTGILFLNSHLAAHQHKEKERESNIFTILHCLYPTFYFKDDEKNNPRFLTDVLNAHHHVFWFGDLNYRIDFPRKQLLGLISRECWEILHEGDQLVQQRDKERAILTQLCHPYPTFPPTFKFRDASNYSEKRLPSWCDRILFKSVPGHLLQQTSYTSLPSFSSSDHKPVVSTFLASIRQFEDDSTLPHTKFSINVTSVKMTRGSKDQNREFCLQLLFYSPFFESPNHTFSSEVFVPSQEQEIFSWEEKQLPVMYSTNMSAVCLRNSYLSISVFDYYSWNPKYLIGQGMIPLETINVGETFSYTIQLFYDGKEAELLHLQAFVRSN